MPKVIAGTILLFQLGAVAAAAPLTDVERQRLLSHLEVTAGWLIDEVSALSPAQQSFRRAHLERGPSSKCSITST